MLLVSIITSREEWWAYSSLETFHYRGYCSQRVIYTVPEAVGRTSALSTMYRVLIAVVSAIVVSVAQPVRLHTDVCFFTLEMVCGTSRVASAAIVCLVWCYVVFTVVHSIADLNSQKIISWSSSKIKKDLNRLVIHLATQFIVSSDVNWGDGIKENIERQCKWNKS